MIKIFVGDTGIYLAELALIENSQAEIILPSTLRKLSEGTYYISLGDFGKDWELFYHFLVQADSIVYCPPDKWSHRDMETWMEKFLSKLSTRIPVSNYSMNILPIPEFITQTHDTRKSEDPQIWIVGCSISHGTGVDERQRYGQIISDKVQMPVSFLTARGTSIPWASSQVHKADIRSGDILIWGLTQKHRFFQFSEKGINHITPGCIKSPELVRHLRAPEFDDSKIHLDRLLDEIDSLYQCINLIVEIENYCNNNNIKLILADLFDDNLIRWLGKRKHYISLSTSSFNNNSNYFDFGDDGVHPGLFTHQWYAKCILEKYFNLFMD
jgi:hypothetical protein